MFGRLNPVFVSALFSWFGAQFIKTFINVVIKRNLHGFQDIAASMVWRTGGMPSSHSAMVTALAVSTGIHEGMNSTLFAVAAAFALVVIRDALGVRLSSGRQAQALNKLGRGIEEHTGLVFAPVKEVNGHTPPEVVFGVLLGGMIGLITSLILA